MSSPHHAEPYFAAKKLFDQRRFSEAFEIYSELANSGDVRCQVFLGWMYDEGVGTRQDAKKALEWYQKAASLGSREGAFYLGRSYASDGDYSNGRYWFEKAAAKDYGPALLWLGQIYLKGLGIDTNFEKGVSYLRRADCEGNFYARREIAVLMIQGKLGILRIPLGLVMFPYAAAAAIVDAALRGYSDKLIG